MDEIIENLFVGDMVDARAGFDGLTICVLEEKPFDEPANATWIPFLAEGIRSLEITAEIIDRALTGGRGAGTLRGRERTGTAGGRMVSLSAASDDVGRGV